MNLQTTRGRRVHFSPAGQSGRPGDQRTSREEPSSQPVSVCLFPLSDPLVARETSVNTRVTADVPVRRNRDYLLCVGALHKMYSQGLSLSSTEMFQADTNRVSCSPPPFQSLLAFSFMFFKCSFVFE